LIKPDTDLENDYGGALRSERLLEQLANFDPKNTRVYDLVMAWGWCLLCGEILQTVTHNFDNNLYDRKLVEGVWNALTSY
jgi:hypothetical protein